MQIRDAQGMEKHLGGGGGGGWSQCQKPTIVRQRKASELSFQMPNSPFLL